MNTFTISTSIVLAVLLNFSVTIPDLNYDSKWTSISKNTAKKRVASYYSGTYPASSGYHNYGWYSIDASGISTGGSVSVRYDSQYVPNRFYLTDYCGLGQWSYSGSSSPYN